LWQQLREEPRRDDQEPGEAHQPTQEGDVAAEVGGMDVQPPQLVEDVFVDAVNPDRAPRVVKRASRSS
jgi:hypothetical protein